MHKVQHYFLFVKHEKTSPQVPHERKEAFKAGETETNPTHLHPADSIPASRKQVVLISKSFPKAKTKAEVLQALKCVASGFSNNSSQESSTLFKHSVEKSIMIVEKFRMGPTKLMYMNNFGLASYFKEMLYSKIKVFKLVCYSV